MTEPEAPTSDASKRGRPRPEATKARDAAVLAFLKTAEAPQSRKQIAEALEIPGNEVYLSIYRLSRATPAEIVKDGSSWKAVADTVAA
jgi:hypothetical protein